MPNALDMFRAHREAADQVHARLREVTTLLTELQAQVHAVAGNREFRALLRDQATLLTRTETLLTEVRRVREQEVTRFWPAAWRRWAVAMVFALASATAVGAGHAWATRPYTSELAALRARADFGDAVVRRTMTMTSAERREFSTLMRWSN
ncbi:MAG: hypothetical protein WBD07_03885 [Vicinamibacterales bacterium]